MFSLGGIVFFLFLSFLHLPSDPSSADTLAIHLDPSVRAENIQLHYHMTGDFGGYGGFAFEERPGNWLFIHTEHDGKPARTFRAVVYAPGCEVTTIRVDDLQTSKREADFQCHTLPEIELRGSVPADGRNQTLDVGFWYVGHWSHEFFGICDGAILTLAIAKVPLQPDGSFKVALPNFTDDPISRLAGPNATFWVHLLDHKTGNIAAELEPPAPSSIHGDLKIAAAYPEPLVFSAK